MSRFGEPPSLNHPVLAEQASDVRAVQYRHERSRQLDLLIISAHGNRFEPAANVVHRPPHLRYRPFDVQQRVDGFHRCTHGAGGLIAYGTSLRKATQRMAGYADKILRGANPGDLPIEAALSHELVVNLQTAQRLGVTIPSEVVAQANQVIPADS